MFLKVTNPRGTNSSRKKKVDPKIQSVLHPWFIIAFKFYYRSMKIHIYHWKAWSQNPLLHNPPRRFVTLCRILVDTKIVTNWIILQVTVIQIVIEGRSWLNLNVTEILETRIFGVAYYDLQTRSLKLHWQIHCTAGTNLSTVVVHSNCQKSARHSRHLHGPCWQTTWMFGVS